VTGGRLIAVVAGFSFAMLLAGSAAAADSDFKLTLSYWINSDGTGRVIADTPIGAGTTSWQACPPAEPCSPTASAPQSDRFLDAGSSPPGTVFVATAVEGGQTASATSVPYQGPVAATVGPKVGGELRVGARVRPIAGRWSGGWGSEFSLIQLQVCSTPGGGNCVVIADDHSLRFSDGAVLRPSDCGKYLRATDRRLGRDTVSPAVLMVPPVPDPPGGNVAATIVGPIAAADGKSDCGPGAELQSTPRSVDRFSLFAAPVRSKGRLEFGKVSCLSRCEVRLTVRQRRRVIRFSRFFGNAKLQTLVLSRRQSRRLKRGKATVTVRIDGQLVAKRRVTLPPR
jgi:hypothetical protein